MGKRHKKHNEFNSSAILNQHTYTQYLNRLTELAVCMFEWKNLPSSVDERFMEMQLFNKGCCVFFRDEELNSELALPVAIKGKLDVYNYPTGRRAYASNGYQRDLDENNSVLIYNNYIRTNSVLDVEMFARRLANLDRIIDVNANAQKTPILITCSEQEKLTMDNLYLKYEGNQPVIFGTKELNPKALTVLKTDAPFISDKLYQLKTQYWNEALTYLGISNINVQKKERLISDEVTRNQGGTIASRYSRLESRRQAVEKINKMFDLNIEFNYREDFQYLDAELISYTLDSEISGGVENE